MRERKILELSEEHNPKVKEVKEQLLAMKENVELTNVGIVKVKKQQMQQSGVVNVDDKRTTVVLVVTLTTPSLNAPAERVMIPFSSLLILPSGFRKNSNEKLAASIGDCNAVMVGPDPSGKGVVVKVGSGMSVVGRRQRWVES
ncbi:uncharacterized protein MONOS_12347 [Monocercomonoides exilis]|uniref:uncharacterized protein n=1 Tax=Monocercomonoides exilis TaxID=2049356 RepID=UPI00355A1C83|nr:hypothetical protein MONOS_12347 [Monocercomonoides exilis]|eukprot:MONOS_12347.1-p1 / transcript=MONOS_12347.1 / gene=MONOS_12347 / organism=Monocercomonoides_exilis_PA203 / gene_product=unspecified product / transcript_product=unspecified product / location=Mono_scaffold00679:3024-3452(+) / protein_length=143 / sequence_SO=supercontig / SO=protein_coding / is_pseudo=false